MQVRATQLQDPSAQLEALRAQSRQLRLRTSDLQAREQQLRELRMQTPAGPEREKVDRQWLNARHDVTAASLDLEGVNDRMTELQRQREEARIEARNRTTSVAVRPAPSPEPPPVEVRGFANVGMAMAILFVAPLVLILVYRLLARGGVRDPQSIEASPRFQRMEQTIESIAMEVERIAEGQRFTTAILAERHPDLAPRVQASMRQETGALTSQ